VAGPIRFRHATDSWRRERVERALWQPLDAKFGATLSETEFSPPPECEACRLSMDNGDLALFAWRTDDAGAYWLGNTETPEALWRTDKETFAEAPYPMARWAQRELLAELAAVEPWLAEYEHVSWFFLPVLFSKDGRETTRAFFRDHAAGFPDASTDAGVDFYERFLSTGVLDEYRYTMASKLGTSDCLDRVRMRATMGEIDAAKLLADAGYDFVPEVELDSGHALDYRVAGETLVEVTRPEPPARRRAGTPATALRETVNNKTSTQLAAHNGALLLVDCTSFRDDEWAAIRTEQPDVGYNPAVVFRMRPDGATEGYVRGNAPLDFDAVLASRRAPR
jgi:hypothetical protein